MFAPRSFWNLVLLFLILLVWSNAQSNDESGTTVAEIGGSLTLNCDTKFYVGVAHLLRWYRTDTIIFEQFSNFKPFIHPFYQNRVQLINESQLQVSRLHSDDSGNYTCQVHFIDGAAFVYQQSTYVIIKDAPEWMYTPPAQMTGVKSGTLDIKCSAIGLPAPVLTWSKDGKLLETNGKIRVNSTRLSGSRRSETNLHIQGLDQNDVGRYRCKASNGFGHIVYTTAVILEGGTLITQFPRNQTVSEGQSAKFDCVATADPNNITYSWYKDGVNINVIDTFRRRVNIHEDGSLNFNTVRQDDVGAYKCVAWNGIGSWFSAEAHLTVTYTPKIDRSRLPSNLYFAIGQSGTIECPVSANPPVTQVEWRKYPSTSGLPNGLINLTSPRYMVTGDFSLVIRNVTKEDTGVYTCIPHNDFGQGFGDGVQVWAKDPPYFTVKPNPVYAIKTSDSLTMPCQANPPDSDPRNYRKPTVTWKKINGLLPDSSRLGDTGNLTVYDARKEYGGHYECVATFDEVSVLAKVELIIESTTPHAPYNLTAIFGHFDVYLAWKPGFDGGFQQNFVVSLREKGAPSAKWQSFTNLIEVPEYKIYDLRPDTEYEIRVLSRNKMGDGNYSRIVLGKTLGYEPDLVGELPTDAFGKLKFPKIEKPLGPAPATPVNLTVEHNDNGGVIVSWEHPKSSPVPILYYRVEYRPRVGTTVWRQDKPVLANQTNTTVMPDDVDDKSKTYYFRVRSFGLLAYSDHTEARGMLLPKEEPVVALSQGAVIGVSFAALVFVAMIIVVIICVLDLMPCRSKRNSFKDANADSQIHFAKSATGTGGSNQWQSYYPYHGGRFALDEEADDIFVVENSKQNTLSDKNSPNGRKEQGWYFPRDGHPETDLIPTDHDTLNHPASSTRASNYATYRSLMHGYYNARAGMQMSPSIRNYPYSGVDADNSNTLTYDMSNAQRYAKDPQKYQITPDHGPDTQQTGLNGTLDNSWFTPYAQDKSSNNINPMNIPTDQDPEVLLRPSLPRHSSMKPVTGLYANEEDLSPFDPSLSTVKEADTPYHQEVEYYNFPQSNRYHSYSVSNWVQGQTPTFDRHNTNPFVHPSHLNSYRSISRRGPSSPMHIIVDPHMNQGPVHKQELEHRSSIGSSVQELKTHYNRDRLLGTVERVRSSSSRSRRPGSYTSANSYNSQLSPIPQNSHQYQYSPFLEHEAERYPELTSPVYYNNNNNRHNLSPQQYVYTRDSSRQTSGLGTTWSHSKIESSIQSKKPSISVLSPIASNEYQTSTSPYQSNYPPHYRYFGVYARPKTPEYYMTQQAKETEQDLSWRRYNQQHYIPSSNIERNASLKSPVNKAMSDSVDENYEFDPVLIDTEPQDFFHIHDDLPDVQSADSLDIKRPPLYAEKRQHSPTSEQYRFEKLRQEYLNFRERQGHAMKQVRIHRLESDIL